MTGTPLDLLSLAGLGTRLLGLGGGEKSQPGGDFERALQSAQDGELGSGRVVVSGPELDVDLTGDQLQRLAQAADMAEAQGASKAAVLIDGMVVTLDIESRMALHSTPAESALVPDVDVVLSAGPADSVSGGSASGGETLLRRLAPAGAPIRQD
ncbi:MAG: hypothetical protein ACIAS6_12170 [Phycisphaerales bacterium JB060]